MCEVKLSFCFAFLQVTGFLQSIRDAAKQVAEQTENTTSTNNENISEEPTNISNNGSPNNPVETSENQAVEFPLWYVGRVVVSHRQAPPTLIDDLVDRFNKRKGMTELEKELNGKKVEQRDGRSNTVSVIVNVENHTNEHQVAKKAKSLDSEKILGGTNNCEENTTEVGKNGTLLRVESFGGRPRSASDGDKTNNIYSSSKDSNSIRSQHHTKSHSRNSSFGGVSENRNVVFKISIYSIACLSVTTKLQLMERRLREVSFCQQVCEFGYVINT